MKSKCPHCGSIYNVKPEHLNKTSKCKRCGQLFTLSAFDDASHIAVVLPPQPPPAQSMAETARPPAPQTQPEVLQNSGHEVKSRCPHCGSIYHINSEYLNKMSTCQRCGQIFTLLAIVDEPPNVVVPSSQLRPVQPLPEAYLKCTNSTESKTDPKLPVSGIADDAKELKKGGCLKIGCGVLSLLFVLAMIIGALSGPEKSVGIIETKPSIQPSRGTMDIDVKTFIRDYNKSADGSVVKHLPTTPSEQEHGPAASVSTYKASNLTAVQFTFAPKGSKPKAINLLCGNDGSESSALEMLYSILNFMLTLTPDMEPDARKQISETLGLAPLTATDGQKREWVGSKIKISSKLLPELGIFMLWAEPATP